MSLQGAQDLVFSGQPLASAIVTRGAPESVPDDLKVLRDDEVRKDLDRPAKNGNDTISFLNTLLWLVAAGIIGSLVYLSALERVRDFAVLKATGVSSRTLLGGLVIQSVFLVGHGGDRRRGSGPAADARVPVRGVDRGVGLRHARRHRPRGRVRRQPRRPAPRRRRRPRPRVRGRLIVRDVRDPGPDGRVLERRVHRAGPSTDLDLDVESGRARAAARCERLRQDDAAVGAGRHPHARRGTARFDGDRRHRAEAARRSPPTGGTRSASSSRRSTSSRA